MALQLSDSVRNAILASIEATIGAAPTLEIRTNAVPANCAAADVGTVLVSIPLPSDWMATPSGGTVGLAGTWQANATGTGTAAHYRIKQGATCHAQGTVGMTGSDLNLQNTSIATGQNVTVTAFSISV